MIDPSHQVNQQEDWMTSKQAPNLGRYQRLLRANSRDQTPEHIKCRLDFLTVYRE